MGKIGDLFVRLGLKNDEFKKGMKEANKETEGFGGKLGKLKAGAVAAWAAVGAAVMKVAKDTISASNTMGDAWEKNMSRMKASYRSLLTQMSTNSKSKGKGWWLALFNPNGTAGMEMGALAKEAGDAAAKMTEAFDAEFELAQSIRLQRGAIQQELNELFVTMRDTTLTQGARQSAMERYKSLLEPLAQAEVAVYSNMLNKAVEAWQAGNSDLLSRKYTTAEMTEFFTNYGTDPDAMRAKYGELANVYENRQNDESNLVIFDTIGKLQAAQNEMSNIDKEMAKVGLSIKKSGIEPIIEGIEELDEELIEVDLEIPELDTTNLDKGLREIQENAERYREELAKIEQYNGMIEDAIISSTANAMQALTDMMFGVADADMKQILAAFLAPFGDTMKQMGSMIMAEGIAMEAFKNSIKNPYAAIAAGAALIAVGSAVSSGLQALTANPTGGGSSASTGSNVTAEVQNYESTITVEVVGRISGSDIILASKNQQNKWNR
jgi:hypothetical protein